MTILLDTIFRPTLDLLVATYARPEHAGAGLEAWTFADRQHRRGAEQALVAAGVNARIRSAYKPLVHLFLEEVEIDGIDAVAIRYPVLETMPRRFLLESYPLAALLPDAGVFFEPGETGSFLYDVEITRHDGSKEHHAVFAPNRSHVDAAGEPAVSPTGWIRYAAPGGSTRDERLVTDLEMLFESAVDAVRKHEWGFAEPFFEELNITVALPGEDVALGCGQEAISLHEALHEDLYFSLLEAFQKKSGRPRGDRGLRPGQIVPEIVRGQGDIRLTIETRPLAAAGRLMPRVELDAAPHAISTDQIREELDRIGGEPLEARTRAGRPVLARYVEGSDPAVMISGGQHANETSGIVGALRAAHVLAGRPGAHFVVSPLENPDGYALHGRLAEAHPVHMHHAARYTAFGSDLECEPDGPEGVPLFERAIRRAAAARSGAHLHVNLHGYPAHEWTRPCSGYVPRGFETWTIPKGFFLIMRHHPEWHVIAERLIDRVTAQLAADAGIRAFNAAQLELFERHAGEAGFTFVNGFPCLIAADTRYEIPLTLVTEYPDETVEGDAFVAAHTAQMQTVLTAYDAFCELMAVA